VQTHFSRAFIKALPRQPLAARLTRSGSELRIFQPERVMVVGARMKNERAPLPEKPNDPRVFDQDHDGHPGMTVRISGWVDGYVYIVQRNITEFRGKRVGKSFAGKVSVKTDQEILGATSAFLRAAPRPQPDDDGSLFVLERVPADITCAQVKKSMERYHREP
jgi:hypothetical protein